MYWTSSNRQRPGDSIKKWLFIFLKYLYTNPVFSRLMNKVKQMYKSGHPPRGRKGVGLVICCVICQLVLYVIVYLLYIVHMTMNTMLRFTFELALIIIHRVLLLNKQQLQFPSEWHLMLLKWSITRLKVILPIMVWKRNELSQLILKPEKRKSFMQFSWLKRQIRKYKVITLLYTGPQNAAAMLEILNLPSYNCISWTVNKSEHISFCGKYFSDNC